MDKELIRLNREIKKDIMNTINSDKASNPIWLLGLATLFLGGFFVIMISYLTTAAWLSAFDDTVQGCIIGLRYSLPSVLAEGFRLITFAANPETIIGGCLLLLIIKGTRRDFGFPCSIAALISEICNKLVKYTVCRPRPDVALHIVEQGGYSFPSGHAMTGMVFYGMLIYCLLRKYPDCLFVKVLAVVMEVVVILVGLSRIYVGVHYPSDVLAGFLLGLAILFTLVYIAERRQWLDKN